MAGGIIAIIHRQHVSAKSNCIIKHQLSYQQTVLKKKKELKMDMFNFVHSNRTNDKEIIQIYK